MRNQLKNEKPIKPTKPKASTWLLCTCLHFLLNSRNEGVRWSLTKFEDHV